MPTNVSTNTNLNYTTSDEITITATTPIDIAKQQIRNIDATKSHLTTNMGTNHYDYVAMTLKQTLVISLTLIFVKVM